MSITTFNISKEVYFNSISSGFKDNIALLNAVKTDYNRNEIYINNKLFPEYHEFLQYVKDFFPNLLDKILLLSNQNAHFYYYNKIFNILSKKDFHLISLEPKLMNKYIKTYFNLNNLIKQATLVNKYNVVSIDMDQKIPKKIHKTILVTTVIDLVILDPILIKIQYL